MTPIAVCIVSFRDPEQIVTCLDALGQSDFAEFEVVICENGGEAAFDALVAALPPTMPGGQPITPINAGANLGYAGGVNVCMRARPDARGWWVLNPDTMVERAALGALVRRLDRGDCHAVGGTLYHPGGMVQGYGGQWRPALARAVSIGYGSSIDTPPDVAGVERSMNYLLGASMLIGRDFLATTGPMREDYFLYAEEVEWCLRGLSRGMRLGLAPDARICHGQGGTTGSANAVRDRPRLPVYMDERNKLLVVRDTTPAWLPIAIPASFIMALLRFARRGAWRQWGHAMAGWRDGILGKRGMPPWLR
ncbi:glycosyltransferase family 2 protein [Sphingomonas turrisvirgatae]|uniref:Glycosyl transferase family 2 n=1 Tax=Sphingomonas turrisvirgatae TaxID=1888892 RepID=A0A1E3LRW9_9SPHN|nr:glycosyltransferase family 2 protein [Sphingomonas turrisvirgatae]ODP36473.1 glycosyl transferase family 2 [Sphingomonas turrisvirgatae]